MVCSWLCGFGRKKRQILVFLIILNIIFLSIIYTYTQSSPTTSVDWVFFEQAEIQTNSNYTLYKPQTCKIPKLDPYHPDVKPFIQYFEKPQCEYPQLTRVTDEGYLQLNDNVKASKVQYAYVRRVGDFATRLSDLKEFDTNERKGVKLTEDLVKVIIEQNGKKHEEFHMYPVRNDKPGEVKARDPNKLNVVFFMIDSMSHSCGERYLKRTMKKLKSSASSVVLNGHTIVGDGTTAQICAMFIGELEKDLPEGRRGFKNAKSVDRWPFIFKEFEKNGYKTLYSEDSSSLNTFNYRLHGFDNPPTSKYLRPFWMAASNYINQLNAKTPQCNPKMALQYLKRFLVNHKDQPSLTLSITSSLAHDHTPNVQLADGDLVNFMQFLEDTNIGNNTIFVIFGDHGDRMGSLRSTIVGKLEERLPFMSFTFPPWFPKRFPNEFRNFRHNANLLTSHFDIYSTLKHLQTFPVNKHYHKRGKSLFTDISRLDRSCADAGILDHWCSCVNYKELSVNDTMVIQAANAILDHINKKTSEIAKENCVTLKLEKVERAGLVTPSSGVQKFGGTFRDKNCDECGVKESKVEFKVDNFEVVFIASPSQGKYEATAAYNKVTKTFTSSEEISRINAYKDQPACVAAKYPHLRPFCYCKKSN